MAVLFEWNNGAVEKVQLAGSFTQWKPVEMVKTLGTDKWALKLDLPPGEYEFKFVVDGNWVHDEGQPSKRNEMGTLNNVINVVASASASTTATTEIVQPESKSSRNFLHARTQFGPKTFDQDVEFKKRGFLK